MRQDTHAETRKSHSGGKRLSRGDAGAAELTAIKPLQSESARIFTMKQDKGIFLRPLNALADFLRVLRVSA